MRVAGSEAILDCGLDRRRQGADSPHFAPRAPLHHATLVAGVASVAGLASGQPGYALRSQWQTLGVFATGHDYQKSSVQQPFLDCWTEQFKITVLPLQARFYERKILAIFSACNDVLLAVFISMCVDTQSPARFPLPLVLSSRRPWLFLLRPLQCARRGNHPRPPSAAQQCS